MPSRVSLGMEGICVVSDDPVRGLTTPSSSRNLTLDLYEQYKAKVYTLCLRYSGGDRGWAEDVTHDVFLTVMRHTDVLSEEKNVAGWIYRVTSNACLSRLRRDRGVWRRVRDVLMTAPVEKATRPDDQLIGEERYRELFAELEKLQPLERMVFSMKYFDGLEQNEIGETLKLSKGYVSKLMTRARNKVLGDE